jgi:cation diffusion facilitator CzcD-associated flavoprotein CzcO
MMAFSDKPFPDDAPLYPSHEQVLEYLEEYAEDVKPLIRFRCQVQDVRLEASSSVDQPVWCVEVRDLVSNSTSSSKFDAVVVANGHYTVPSLPHIEGIEQWNAEYCGSILHSKAYRKPEEFKGKKVLVIGNSASGLDVAYQVSQECDQPVLLSSRSVSAFGTMPGSSWRKDIGEVVEFLPVSEHSRAVRLRDGSVESDIDAVIFCTGYFYSYPFLSSHDLPLIGDGLRVQGTFEHLFHSIHPSLVFPVINLKVIPFPLAEHQAAVVARVWSGRLSLPSTGKMHAWEESVVEQKGSGKYFHLKKFPEDAAQINNLFRWAKSAAKVPGLVNGGQGRLGKPWGKEEVWLRSKFSELKAAYLHRGEARMRVRTVKELGFDFDEWTRTAMPDDLKMFLEAQVLDEDAA